MRNRKFFHVFITAICVCVALANSSKTMTAFAQQETDVISRLAILPFLYAMLFAAGALAGLVFIFVAAADTDRRRRRRRFSCIKH